MSAKIARKRALKALDAARAANRPRPTYETLCRLEKAERALERAYAPGKE